MKKITLFLLLLCLSLTLSAQVLNQSAAWPNTDWTVTGTYNADPTAFEADPTATSNFAFDDDDAGFGSDDDIAAESPAIDLTAAFTAGETWLFVDVDYTYNDLGDVLNLEYWDADSNTWEVWQQFVATAVQPTDNFCNGARDSFTSNQLNIAGFTATQLSGFQYRIAFYDDGPGGAAGYEWGFCFDAPTISSQAPPTCPDPEMLSAANSTASSGELSWTETGTATIWNIEVVIAGNAPTGTPTDVAATNPYIATGLSASTNYEFYVQSDCGGGDVSNWIGPFAFATECATFTAPFSEDFENGGTIPLCWTMDGGEDWQFSDTGAGNHIGDNGTITGSTASNNYFAWVDSSGNDGPSTLTSPLIDVSGLTNPALSFYELSDNEGNANSTLDVEVWDGAAWNNVGTYNTNTVGWELKIIGLSGLTITGDVQVRFLFSETVTGDFYDDIAIDDVTLDEAPSCLAPTFLTANNITATTADLGWTEGGSATQWNIEVVLAGDAPTGTPTNSGVTNPFTVTGLSPATNYEFYVQADCGGGDLSDWTGPFAFLTECATFTAPYTEDFENGGTIPVCWSMDGGEDWQFSDTGAGNHIGDNGTITGSTASNNYFAWVDSSGNDGPSTLTSPLVDVSGLTNPALSFYELSDNEGNANSTLDVEVWDGAAWNNVGTYNTNTVGWELKIINLGGLTITGDVQARFIFSETVTGDFYDDIAIDDVTFDEAPSCFSPNLLTATNLSLTSTEVGWNEVGSATEWNIEYGESGFAQGTGTVEAGVTTNPYVLSGLMPDTYYEFYVQAVCGVGDESTYSGPFEFYTGYCVSEPSSNDGDGVTNVTVGVTDFPSFGDVTYENHTSPVVNVFQGIDTNVAITFATGFTYGTNIWIDFNDDLVFDNATELVFQGESTNANPTTLDASFVMPATAPLGQHRMRIGTADSGQATPNPCYNGTWGVTLDFTVNIQQLTCTLPEATYSTVPDCAGDQFFIEVDVTSMGDATSLEISNDFDASTVQALATGVYQAGPFPFGNSVKVFVTNEQDNNCVISSDAFELLACPPDNDNCTDATVAAVNTDGECTVVTPGTLLEATPSSTPSGSCTGNPDDDVWFQFVATDDTHLISLENINGSSTNLDHGLYEGTCGSLTEIYCSEDDAIITPTLTVGNTYYIRVFSSGSGSEDSTFDLCIRPGLDNVIVDQTTYTVEQLVQDILIGGECAQISNITYSTGTDFGEENGIGYFSMQGDGIGFPFDEGIILTTGDANLASGPNTNAMSDGTTAWPGDTDLETAVGISTTNNASIIEFDFVPLAQEISFDFLMASEEYNGGSFECTFSDAFAFLLTDSNGVTTNLAVLPNTTTPILVTNIHQANTSCGAENEQYFGGYIPDNLPPISFDGRTTVFTAQSTVNVGETYHIKLVIADQSDAAFDSGVFLKAGSFDLGELDLGDDITIASGEATCLGEPVVLDTGAPNLEHFWFKNGLVIDGETSSTLTVTEPDIYTAQVIFSNQCFLMDEILVEFLEPPVLNEDPADLESCSATGEGFL